MGLNKEKTLFVNSILFSDHSHNYQPFKNETIDIKLPMHPDIRLFIFNPTSYPYMWLKYIEGLRKEYTRIGAQHILDFNMLESPGCCPLVILAVTNGEVVAGIRFHGPIVKASEAFVLHEMADGSPELLKQNIESWLPDRVLEPKGIWINSKHPSRKLLLSLMARSGIYGTLLLECRYLVLSCPQNIKKMHFELGMTELTEVGCVPYPNASFKTSCGFVDMQAFFTNCTAENSVVLRREWSTIHQHRIEENTEKTPLSFPVILDGSNPFHTIPIESMLMDKDYKKVSHLKNMHTELKDTHQKTSEYIENDEHRWVLYPWQKTAIEILGPVDFKALHTNRNRNKITATEQKKLSTLRIGIIGLSTGHIIAHTLVMEGLCGHLKLADFDTLETSNLNRIPASLLDIGVNKAVIVARRVAEVDPYVSVEIFDQGIQQTNIENFVDGLDIIIEECDSLDVKLLVREAASKHSIPVLMSTSDLGMIDVERYDLNKQQKPFHGLVDATAEEMKNLSRQDQARYALSIVEGDKISKRLAASMTEIGHSIKTWPQLASDVIQGAALVASAVRRIGTGKETPSSRSRVDMDAILKNAHAPQKTGKIDLTPTEKPEFSGDAKADMLLAANFAPSAGNIQPWKIYWKNKQLNFEINRELTSARDINWRASMVSIGTACFNAEAVAAHHKLNGHLTYFPEKNQPDLVARWIPGKPDGAVATQQLADLFPFLLSRTTNRELGKRKPLPDDFVDKIKVLNKHYPINLHLLTQEDELAEYGAILAESERLRHLCKHLHHEMTEELRWPGKDSLEDGIDIRTLGLNNKDLNVMSVIQREDVMRQLRDWNAGYALGDYSRERSTHASAMIVVTVKESSDAGYLQGGYAIQHLWLLAEQIGLAVQPISPVFLYANTKQEVQKIMKDNYVDEIWELRNTFNTLLKINKGNFPVLALRLTHAEMPEFFSLRRA